MREKIPSAISNKNSITKICIDDFAIKKRHRHGTVMINIETHRIIDMINSRDTEDVVKWLKLYKNLQVVPRDGSVSYKSAIQKANENTIPKFHV